MNNLNRRHTEALEKSARAQKRLAVAEDTISRHLGDFLRDVDTSGENKAVTPGGNTTPPKTKRPRK